MPSNAIILPQQQRSQETQRRLLDALHHCLQTKFFEHISIKELAEHADVSVGTFYRRFKNKESLLPLLYQDFGNDLLQWTQSLEETSYTSLDHAIEDITLETFRFLSSRKSIFRTLHLNARLHTELVDSDKIVDRKVVYKRLAAIFLRFEQQMHAQHREETAGVMVYTLVTTLLDKVLYPNVTPAIASDLDAKAFTAELTRMLKAYAGSR